MTSSVLDGAGCESPAPPAFSPLTDPADPGNREPSVGVPINAEAALDDAGSSQRRDGITTTANGLDSHLQSTADLTKHSRHDHDHSRPQTARDPAAPATPATPARPQLDTTMINNAMDLDMPMNSGMGYTASPGLDLYSPYAAQQSSQLLMTLARLSATQMIALPPSTVRPSQVSLPPHPILDTSDNLVPATPNAANAVPHVSTPLESFARIEFADSVFQMTTYAVVIGRDQRALDQARRDERRHVDYERKKRDHEERGLPAPLPPSQDRGKFSKSYVSEEGGMLGPESDGDDNPRPAKRRKTSGGVGSASGDSQRVEPAAGELASLEDKNPINRQYVSHTPGAAAVNLSALRPSPYYVPFIGIHSPGPNIASRTKAISREHLKIKFNKVDGVFEAIPLHKNGFFCEDVHYKEESVVLKSGDHLQIKDVDFVFIINGVPHGKTGAEDGLEEDGVSSRRYSEGGKEMSFDFESTHDPARRSTSPEEIPAVVAPREDSDSELSDPAEDDPEPEPEDAAEQEVMETIEKDLDSSATVKPEMSLELLAGLDPIVPKKRGPGRPPKNGIMSKREERLRKKAAMEIAKKNMPQPPPGEPPIKRKVGRPRKHPLPENAPDRPEKRKYKPRKSKNGEEGEGEGSDLEKTIKERRREKPKTPPLELDRNDYTEEQLQKPPKNYGMLIDEVLTAAPDGLTLKQIYKRIQMKYPFYYFTVDTKGWESSVRHNLIGNDAFKKNEETHLWSRVPGIDIDAGKKRTKATSPDHATSMHTFGQHYSTSATPTPQMFHAETGLQQGYRSASVPQRPGYAPGQVALGQHPQPQLGAQAVGGTTQQAPRQPYSIPGQVQGTTPSAAFGNPAGGHPPQGSAQTTAYSSPYASRPPPAATTQPGGPTQGVARQGLPPNHSATPVNGLPRAGPPSAQAAPPTGARPAQPAVNGNSAPLKPAVAPELVRHITNFIATVTEQLKQRTPLAEAIAMSVVNRGLGLATESTVPEEPGLERIVFGVFETSQKKLGANQFLNPGLVQALGNFKSNMITTLEPKMGKLNSERLILSAMDRVLGFTDRCTMPGPQQKGFNDAEKVLIGAIQRVVTEHQRSLASVSSVPAPPPVPTPGPSSAPSTAPGSAQIATQGHAPAPNHAPTGAYSSTTPSHQGARPAPPLATSAAPGPARPPAPMQSTPTAQSATAAGTQQVPRPATFSAQAPQTSAAPTTQARPQAPVSGPAQGSVQAPGQYSAPATAASARNPALTGTVQMSATGSAQPQSPAHALAQAQAQAAAQNAQAQKPAQVPGPASSPATATNQIAGQPVPPATSAGPSVPKAPTLTSAPTISQPQNQQALPPKPQGPAPAAAPASQRLGHGAPVPNMAPPAVVPAQTATTAAAPAPVQPRLPTTPAAAAAPAQAAPVAATPAAVSQGNSSLPAPIQRPMQPVTTSSLLSATAQGRIASSSPGTSHTMSQSPTPPVASNPPAPAQATSQGAQTAAPVPAASAPPPAQPPTQPPAPPAPMANMATAATPTAPASAPPPTPPAATVTAAR